ncbi:MAG: hypothetical protein ACLUVC_00155 [Longibaculum sp.]
MKEEKEIIDEASRIYFQLKNNGFDRDDMKVLISILQAINEKNVI